LRLTKEVSIGSINVKCEIEGPAGESTTDTLISKERLTKSERRTAQEYIRGIDYCIDNARRLLEDADTLDELDRFPSAIGLAVFAQEELGKAMMLLNDLLQLKRIKKKNWRHRGKFTQHLTKLCAPSRYRSLLGPEAGVHDEKAVVLEMWKLFQDGRLRCFYVDWCPPAVQGWSSPTNSKYVDDLVLLVGSALPLAKGWLYAIEPLWKKKKQALVRKLEKAT